MTRGVSRAGDAAEDKRLLPRGVVLTVLMATAVPSEGYIGARQGQEGVGRSVDIKKARKVKTPSSRHPHTDTLI